MTRKIASLLAFAILAVGGGKLAEAQFRVVPPRVYTPPVIPPPIFTQPLVPQPVLSPPVLPGPVNIHGVSGLPEPARVDLTPDDPPAPRPGGGDDRDRKRSVPYIHNDEDEERAQDWEDGGGDTDDGYSGRARAERGQPDINDEPGDRVHDDAGGSSWLRNTVLVLFGLGILGWILRDA